MAIDSIAASVVAGSQQQFALFALRAQIENESATVNLVRDAVKAVQQSEGAPADRHNPERLVDVLV